MRPEAPRFERHYKEMWKDLTQINLIGLLETDGISAEEQRNLQTEAWKIYNDYVVDFFGENITDEMRTKFVRAVERDDATKHIRGAIDLVHDARGNERKFIARIRDQQDKLISATQDRELQILQLRNKQQQLITELRAAKDDDAKKELQAQLDAVGDEIWWAKGIVPMTSSMGILQWHPAELDAQVEVDQPKRRTESTAEEKDLTDSKPGDSAALTRLRKQLAAQIEFQATTLEQASAHSGNVFEQQRAALETTIQELENQIKKREEKESNERRSRSGKEMKQYDLWDMFSEVALNYKIHRKLWSTRRKAILLIERIRRKFIVGSPVIREAYDHTVPLDQRLFILHPRQALIDQLKSLTPPLTLEQASNEINLDTITTVVEKDLLVPEAIDVITYADLYYCGVRRVSKAGPITQTLVGQKRPRNRIPKTTLPESSSSSSSSAAHVEEAPPMETPVPAEEKKKVSVEKPVAIGKEPKQKGPVEKPVAIGKEPKQKAPVEKSVAVGKEPKQKAAVEKPVAVGKKPKQKAAVEKPVPAKKTRKEKQSKYDEMDKELLARVPYGTIVNAAERNFIKWMQAKGWDNQKQAEALQKRSEKQRQKLEKRKAKKAKVDTTTSPIKVPPSSEPKPTQTPVQRKLPAVLYRRPKEKRSIYDTMTDEHLKTEKRSKMKRAARHVYERWMRLNGYDDTRVTEELEKRNKKKPTAPKEVKAPATPKKEVASSDDEDYKEESEEEEDDESSEEEKSSEEVDSDDA